jgi:hypothetical protein
MGVRPEGKSIGRKNPNESYCKDNCQWETDKEQGFNKRSTKVVDVEGETLVLEDAIKLIRKRARFLFQR